MAARAKKPPGDEGTPNPTRPARLRVMRPEVEEVLRSPRRGRPKLQQHKEGGGGEGAAEDGDGASPPRYDCAFQDEKEEGGGFAPPAMVWCKVRSHPWWPAQVFDAADASKLALLHARSGGGHTLVAYFWDKTFAWTDPSALLPFRAHFARLAAQSSVYSYVTSVDIALEEVERRVEAGLSCSCAFSAGVAKKQEVENSGIREGAYGAVVDDAYMRDTFRGEPFLEYIAALATNPLAGADRLDLATAKAQLRSFNRMRVPRELPEFVIYGGIEEVPTEATTHTKRKEMEKSGEDDVIPSKEKKPRCGESSLRKRDAANEEAVDEDSSVPRKSSARKKASKDVDKGEPPAKKDAIVEDSPVPSSKQSKSKINKSSAEKKQKKDSLKDTDKGESLAEPAEENAANEESSMPTGEATDGTLSKERKPKISKSSAKTKKKDISKDADKKESLPQPAEEDAMSEDIPMTTGEATDGALSKGGKSKTSKSSVKTKKKDTSKDADKKESLPESAKEDATGDDSSTPGATDGTLSRKRKSSRSSAKKEKQETSKDTDKNESLPEPAKEEATGDDSSTPVATDGTLSKESKSKSSKSSVKKNKKQDTSTSTDGVETVAGSKTPVNKAVDGTLSESKSGRRLRSTNKTEDASEGLKGPKKNGAAETTKGEDKDAALLKENNLGRRASSARQKDKITEDGDRLAGSSVKDSVSPAKKTSVTKDSPILISEHGRKKKKLSELLVETDTPNRSGDGKSKARRKRAMNVSTEEPDRETEDTVKARGKRSLPASAEKPDRTDTPNHSGDGKSKARRKRAMNVSTEEPDHDTEDTVTARGERSFPASAEKPARDVKDTKKTRGKRSLPKSTEEPEDPDRDTKDTMKTTKRKKLDTLGDLSSQPPLSPKGSTKAREATPKAAGKKSQPSPVVKANGGDTLGDLSSQPQPLYPKRSTKAREATPKAAELKPHTSAELKPHTSAELKPHTSSVVKANGEASQTRSRRAKNSKETVPDKSPRSVKPNKGKKGATSEETLSCGEMHSQLCVAASDLKKVGEITPASVGFFTEFSKSSCPSSCDVEKEIPIEAANADSYASSPHAEVETPEEAAEKVTSPQAGEEKPEVAAEKVASRHADEEMTEAAEKVASPHADKETPEVAAEKVASPHADEKIPEEAAEKVTSPEANKETHEEAAEKVASPPAKEVTPEKAKNSEPSPSEPEVADHMKDDYWADILINVEEPISRLKRKKDKSKSKTSKTKEPQAAVATPTKEPQAEAVPSKEPQAAEATPSKEPQAAEATPTKESQAAEATPTKEPQAEATPTKESQAAEATPTKESQAAEATPTNESQAAEAVPTKESQAAEAVPTKESQAAEAVPTKESQAAEAVPTKESQAAEATPTKEPQAEAVPTKESQAADASPTEESQAAEASPTKELPVSVGNMEVEEANKKADSKQEDTENGNAEAKQPGVVAANGVQANAEETETEDLSLSGLVLHFSRADAAPSQSDLIKIFSQYGPVSEARTEKIGDSASSAQVVFRRRMDAEAAFGGSGKMTSMLGPALVSFRLTDFPSAGGGGGAAAAASGDEAGQGALE